jgi:uncharacterized protein DUF1549/uncharacterized protein DUF1553/cytochrome c
VTSRCCFLLFLVAAGRVSASDRVDYAHDVRPILAQKCFACHGALKQQSGLRLDAAAMIRKGGDSGPIIAPGKPEDSLLFRRVSSTDVDVRMPPEGEGEPLDGRQLGIVKAWIEQGAEAPDEPVPPDPRDHWAFRRPVRSDVPQTAHPSSSRNPIDAFIAHEQDQMGLVSGQEAAKNLLVRRVYLDLIGLPPTTEELHAYLADEAPDAYERVVDRLLASPEYGRRWGRHWMDVWRYSDWAGYKQEVRESQRHIWRWRDWIVESLNADKGYDRMVVEMLAGDEIAPANADVLRATGYLVRNRHASNRNIWLDATVEHTAKAFLGLTINCARCHDHKYDPIPQIDYYRMRAIFEPHDVATDRLVGQPDLLKDGLVRIFDDKPDAPTYRFIRGNEKQPDKEHPVEPGLPEVLAGHFDVQPVNVPAEARSRALRPEFRDEDLAAARKTLEQAETALTKARQSQPVEASSDGSKPMAFALAEVRAAVAAAELESLEARWKADLAKCNSLPATHAEELALIASKAERQAALRRAELAVVQGEQALASSQKADKPDDAKAKAALSKAEKDVKTARENLQKAAAATEKTDANYTAVAKPYPETSTGRRLALARWITRADNPLTARVAVNHLWLRHFGVPLVENVFDFGLRSARPIHTALLDWLAVKMVEHGWSMKHLHRLAVTSATYRLASGTSDADAQSLKIDPDNRYLWHMNTRRLEAELVRDCLLSMGGSLDFSFGGPDIDQELGESSRRRSIYIRHAYEKQMQFLVLFDAANVNECYRRSESVVPQQALAVANSSLSLVQSRLLARALGEATTGSTSSNRDFVQAAFERILSRTCSDDEQSRCEKFLADQAARLALPNTLTAFEGATKATVSPSPDPLLRARESLVHVLLNHNDFLTIR